MTASKKNKPTLRFKGFEGEWKEDFTGNHIDLISGFAFKGEDISEDPSGIPILRGINITEGYIRHTKDIDRYYIKNPDAFEKFRLKKGDLVLGMDGSKVGRNYALISKRDEDSLLIQRVARLRAKNRSSLEFIYHHINSIRFHKYVDEVNTSSGIPHISSKQIQDFAIHFPSLPEQQKIASFLSAIDEKIQQLTRKKALLEQYKKGVTQQLFSGKLRFKPEDGKAYPKWEEKSLGVVAEILKGKGISKGDIDPAGDTECIRYGQLYTDYKETINEVISRTSVPPKDLVLSKVNDVIIPSSGETQLDIATASCILKSGVALGGDLNIIRSKINGVFLSYYLNSQKRFDIAKLAQGKTVVHLYPSQLVTLRLSIPSIAEQQKIATFLSAIDTKIQTVAMQIGKTQEFKKGLLQKMFV